MNEKDDSEKDDSEINTSNVDKHFGLNLYRKSMTNFVFKNPSRRFSRLNRIRTKEANYIKFKYTKHKSIINPQQFHLADSTIFSKHLARQEFSNRNEITGIPEDKKKLNEYNLITILKIEKITDIKICKKNIEIENEENKKIQFLDFYYLIEGKLIYTKKDNDDKFYDYEYYKSYIPMNLFTENQTFKIVGSQNDPKINNIISLLIK